MATRGPAKPVTRVRLPSLPCKTKVRYLILNHYYGLYGRVVSEADALKYWGEYAHSDPGITWIVAENPEDESLRDQPQPWDPLNVEVVADKSHLQGWLGQGQ